MWPIKLQPLCASSGYEWQFEDTFTERALEVVRGDQIQKLLVGNVTFQKNKGLAQAFDTV